MPLKKQSPILTFALMLALSVAPELLMGFPLTRLAQAQSPTATPFPLPSVVPNGTTVRVDGSDSMEVVNRVLKQRFEAEYPGTVVNLAAQGTDSALQGVINGTVDLAAIGRSLTGAELNQGLVEAPISREKIAIVVGADNPFQGDLTFEQFARMFRGEIRDWSEVGGAPGPIRFIDRPADNDTRLALSKYSVFQTAPFETGANATQVTGEDTAAVVSQLGRDGISYAVASQVLDQPGVRMIRMHGTLPDDPRYPYSQPRNYVYKNPASPAIAAFLGFVGSSVGQQAVANARSANVAATPATPSPASPPSPTPVPEATVRATSPTPAPETAPGASAPVTTPAETTRPAVAWWPWLLLPLAALAGLLLWGRRGRGAQEPPLVEPPTAPPPVPLAERTGSVVTADRASLPERPVAAPLPELPVEPTIEPTAAPILESAIEPVIEPPAPTVESAAIPIPEPPPAPVVESPQIAPSPLPSVALGGAAVAAGLIGLAGSRPQPQSRIVLTPRTTELGYAYWEAPEAEKAELRQQGGEQFTLKIADVTNLDPATATPNSVQQYDCAETEVDRFVPLPEAERDYIAEIGYFTPDQRWLLLARSAPVQVTAPIAASAATIVPDATIAETAMPRAAVAPVVAPVEPEIEEVRAQAEVEATRFNVGQTDLSGEALASVDAELPDLPAGYGTSWITLLPRDPQWAYAYWEVPDSHKQAVRQQGGQRLALRFYDITAIDLNAQKPHSLQQYDCDEMARDWYIPVPVSDRDYMVEIGYVTEDGQWLMLARSNPIKVPPVYPSDWYEEQFITVDWSDNLQGETLLSLLPPNQRRSFDNPIYDHIFGLAESAEAQRVAGSLFGSMQQVPPQTVSSFALGSGAGLAARTESGIGMSGVGMYTTSGMGMSGAGLLGVGLSGVGMSGVGLYTTSGIGMMSGVGLYTTSGLGMTSGIGMYTTSGIGMSGIGMSGIGMSGIGMGLYTTSGIGMSGVGIGPYTTSGIGMSGIGMYSASGIGMSGIGFSASMPPLRTRKFWLLADAELIIYGATEPDATVTIAGRPVQLNPDGTFRFHLSFQDGFIDFPILAVAADGVQSRSIHMQFNRETPSRSTNSKEEAQDEPF